MDEELSTSWHSYPKIYALGHGALKDLFNGDVQIEEKVDGSQFSFGKFNGEIKVRSKGKEIYLDAPEKMFLPAIEQVLARKEILQEGWTYRGEFLGKPKHNCLEYARTPKDHIILFDINIGYEAYLRYGDKKLEAERLGFEVVPEICLRDRTAEGMYDLLKADSILGGQKIEGFVIKNYGQFGRDKKALMGKYVSEAFKEVHKKTWGESHGRPGQGDVIALLCSQYKNPARWQKSVHHLRDDGKITSSPKDIGLLIKAVRDDVKSECEDEIKETLYKWAVEHVVRGSTAGLPEWYKKELLKKQNIS